STEGENDLRVEYSGEAGPRRSWSAGVTGRYASRLTYDIVLPGPLRLDQNGAPAPLTVDTSFTAWRAGAFADWTERWGSGVRTTVGARVDHYDYLEGAWRVSPRASLSLDLGGPVLRAAAGRYWQPPSYIWLVGDTTNPGALKPFFADHLVIGIERRPRPDLKLQLEAYYKRYGDYPARVFRPQAVLSPTGFDDVKSDIPFGLEPLQSEGVGQSWGVEAFAQKRLSSLPLYGLASLSVAWTDFEGLDGISRVGAFDTRFIGNLLLGWRPNVAWEVSGKFRFATGLPSTPFITSGPGAGQLDFSRYQEGPRLPTFHALDLRVDRRWNWRSVQLVTYLDVQNVYNRQNVSQYTWDERKQEVTADESLGVLPTIGINLEF
ncbi:MAG: TonB-dependent receptor, partial [Gemmatimonadota bacterium]|nr:TonB-dependent receptor [Gemmatimonadota bacterium]